MPFFSNKATGVKQYYTLVGSGNVKVVVISGFCQLADQWFDAIDHFSASTEFQLVFFDNRGKGRTESPRGRITTSLMARDAADLIDHLGWEKVHVVGHSMGGMIALELGLLCGHRIQSMSLVSTTAGQFTDVRNLMVHPTVFKKIAYGLYSLFSMSLTTEILTDINVSFIYGSKTQNDPKKYTKAVDDQRKACSLHMLPESAYTFEGLVQQLGAVYTHHVCAKKLERIRSMSFPVVVLAGDEDIMVYCANSRYLAQSLDAQYIEFEGFGHDLYSSCPTVISKILTDTWNDKKSRMSQHLVCESFD